MVYLGIDVGEDGGIAMIEGEVVTWWRMPMDHVRTSDQHQKQAVDGQALREIFRAINRCRGNLKVVVEDNWAWGSMKNDRAFAFGHSVGVITGFLAVADIQPALVTPQVWKRRVGLVAGSDKVDSIRLVSQVALRLGGPAVSRN